MKPGVPALKYALQLLEKRPYSKRRLAFKLNTKGYIEELDEVLATMESRGFIDDERFTRGFVEQRQLIKPCGKKRIILDLVKRGIDRELAEKAWLEWQQDKARGDEESPALAALRHRVRRVDLDISSWREQQRLLRFLGQRGFSYTEAKEALAKLVES